MIEVCSSFKCSERTWFLSVALFDKFLSLKKGKRVYKNSDVHSLGVAAMYVASKYEDIYPIVSKVASEKISHKAISQEDILAYEKEFLLTMDFNIDLVTVYDIYQYLFIVLKDTVGGQLSGS